MANAEALAVLFIILTGCAFVALAFTFAAYTKRQNLPLLTLFASLLILNFFNFINALVWYNENTDLWWKGQGLCDIEVKLYLALGQSIIGATASIFKQLACILDTSNQNSDTLSGTPKSQIVFNIVTCYVLPGFLMSVHYVVQPSRYQIERFNGCRLTWDDSWLSILLLWSWYPLMCAICLFYALMTTARLIWYQRNISAIFKNPNIKTNKNRFVRLFGLSTILTLSFLPLTIYFFVENASSGIVRPYLWDSTHPADWAQRIIVSQDNTSGILLDRWVHMLSAILVIAFFGTSTEAYTFYRRCSQHCRLHQLCKSCLGLWKIRWVGMDGQDSRLRLGSVAQDMDSAKDWDKSKKLTPKSTNTTSVVELSILDVHKD